MRAKVGVIQCASAQCRHSVITFESGPRILSPTACTSHRRRTHLCLPYNTEKQRRQLQRHNCTTGLEFMRRLPPDFPLAPPLARWSTLFRKPTPRPRHYTFRVSRRRCEMYSGYPRLCVCVCLSLVGFPHYCMDPDIT